MINGSACGAPYEHASGLCPASPEGRDVRTSASLLVRGERVKGDGAAGASAAVALELGVDPRCLHRIERRTVRERVAR